jgi:hypothetical protein
VNSLGLFTISATTDRSNLASLRRSAVDTTRADRATQISIFSRQPHLLKSAITLAGRVEAIQELSSGCWTHLVDDVDQILF